LERNRDEGEIAVHEHGREIELLELVKYLYV
jgi:hypothetical protein